MRVILDTNVLLSALLSSRGAPARLLDSWERKRFTLVACDALIDELRQVGGRPFFKARLRFSTVELLAAAIQNLSSFYKDPPPGPVAPDPKDSFLLALAEATTSEFLVTGDKELQARKRHKTTRIVSPAEMVQLLKQDKETTPRSGSV